MRGIIPAYAGSTPPAARVAWVGPDHPRIRGEHAGWATGWPTPGGSSPHTRGAPFPCPAIHAWGGIIPAYAGSTQFRVWGLSKYRDHPRIRGEHRPSSRDPLPARGSSPHTRGAPQLTGDCDEIPLDHPRIRGEHCPQMFVDTIRGGSSPHTRGAPRHLHLRRQASRIIPAYAGSTPPAARVAWVGPDHPRIRGEHMCRAMGITEKNGSSPHTRGAPRL